MNTKIETNENQINSTLPRTYTFEKDPDGSWYIVLPEWEGSRSDLLMVAGADRMLDKMSNGTNEVQLMLSETPFEDHNIKLRLINPMFGGGNYIASTPKGIMPMWLCKVTKFVFGGKLPSRIYGKL
jgi:hypothetical protein